MPRYIAKITTTHVFKTDRVLTADEIAGMKVDLEGDPTNENCVENNFDGELSLSSTQTNVTIDPT